MSARSKTPAIITSIVDTSVAAARKADRSSHPAESDALWSNLIQVIARLAQYFKNYVVRGYAGTPTTASTQATGAAGATVVRVNLEAIHVIVEGVQKEFAAEADRVLHDTTVYTGVDATTLTDGKSAIITIVAKNSGGTVTLVNVKGGTATTGSQVEPTDAQIQAVVTGSLGWVKVANVLINRTGDTTITQSQDNTARPALAVNADTDLIAE